MLTKRTRTTRTRNNPLTERRLELAEEVRHAFEHIKVYTKL